MLPLFLTAEISEVDFLMGAVVCYKFGSWRVLVRVVFMVCLLWGGGICPAVSMEGVESEAERASGVYNRFMSEMLYPRISCYYSGFTASEVLREKSMSFCKSVKESLFEIYRRQKEMLEEVQEYEGDDWYEIYGKSGVWKAAKRYSEQTKGYIEFVNVYEEYCELKRGDDIERVTAKELGLLRKYSLTERMKLLESYYGDKDARQLSELADEFIEKGELEGSVLLGLKLCGMGSFKFFEKAGSAFGKDKIEWLGGNVVADDIMSMVFEEEGFEDFIELKSVYEVSLGFKSKVSCAGDREYEMMKRVLEVEKFQRRSVYFYFAEAVKDDKPYEGLEGYLLSVHSRGVLDGSRIYVRRERAAKEAALLAYKGYEEGAIKLDVASRAVGYYVDTAEGDDKDRFAYVYAGLQLEGGKKCQAVKLLERLADCGGELGVRARLDMAAIGLDEEKGQEWLKKTAKEVKSIIEDLKGEEGGEEKLRAVKIYCAVLMARRGDEYREEVLRVVGENGFEDELAGEVAAALTDLGRYEEAAEKLSSAVLKGKEGLKDVGEYLVYGVNDRLEEEVMAAERGEEFVKNLDVCASVFASGSLAEVKLMILARREGWEKTAGERLREYEEQNGRDDVEYLRCRGFYEERKGKWEEAVMVWSRLCGGKDVSRRWWQQGKYHQLLCSLRAGMAGREELSRIVDVLVSMYEGDLMEPWKGLIFGLGKGQAEAWSAGKSKAPGIKD